MDYGIQYVILGLFIANKVVNNMAVPNLTGIISIVLIAISTLFIVDILKLKNKII